MFLAFVAVMLAIDLGVFHRQAHIVSFQEAAIWSVIWVVVALLFNLIVLFWMGKKEALEFLTGYLVEKALSADNIFVFAVLFNYFAVPSVYRHRVLFWGVLGAIVMRFALIMAGAALLEKFHWVVYIFGAIVIFSGIKLLRHRGDRHIDPGKNPVIRLARRFLPSTSNYVGQKFLVHKDGKLFFTPLALVLLAVETTDVVFAVDSVPAIFAIARDPFIVFTSNICAILGLRALYFLLEGVMRLFQYLDEGLSVILIFISVKMLLSEVYPLVLTIIIMLSLWVEHREKSIAARFADPPEKDKK